MKKSSFILTIFPFVLILLCKDCIAQTYRIVKKTNSIPGDINKDDIKKLTEPLRALAAFYSAMGGTMCNDDECELTTALGLGKQGSDAHKILIKKYFPQDKVAKAVLAKDCYLRPSGASTFSDFEYLTITKIKNTVKVYYALSFYNKGTIKWTRGPDIYLFQDNKFKKVKRNLWVFADK